MQQLKTIKIIAQIINTCGGMLTDLPVRIFVGKTIEKYWVKLSLKKAVFPAEFLRKISSI